MHQSVDRFHQNFVIRFQILILPSQSIEIVILSCLEFDLAVPEVLHYSFGLVLYPFHLFLQFLHFPLLIRNWCAVTMIKLVFDLDELLLLRIWQLPVF